MALLQEKLVQYPAKGFLVVGFLVGAYMLFAGGGFDKGDNEYLPQIETLKGEIEKSQKKLDETLSMTQNKQKFQEDMERVSQTFRLVLDYLPKELDTQDLLKKIASEARASGVELVDFVPKDTVQKDFFDEIPMSIKLKGNYVQLVTFLANVSKLPRIVNIRNIEISNPKITDGVPFMQLSGLLVGYRYKEGK